MGFGKRLRDWNAASEALERDRDTQDPEGRPLPSATQLLVAALRVAAVLTAVVGIWAGVAIGRSLEGWSRPLGLSAPGWTVVVGAVVSALALCALAAVVTALDANAGKPAEAEGVAA
jgi:hypothetical protein